MTAYRRPKAPEPFDVSELVGMVVTFEALPTRYVWDRQIKSATRPVEKMAKYIVEHSAAIAVQLDAARGLYEGLTSGADNKCYRCEEFPGANPKCGLCDVVFEYEKRLRGKI